MLNNNSVLWKQEYPRQLSEALLSIDNIKSMRNFLRDVMTEKEIVEISARLEAARLLTIGEKYTVITEKTKLSSRTVARISDWLQNGNKGYQEVIKSIGNHHSHITPVRAE